MLFICHVFVCIDLLHAYSQPRHVASLATTAPINNYPIEKTIDGRKTYRRKGRPNLSDIKSTTKVAAPLVDSTLLRFLSAQKSQIVSQEIINGEDISDANSDVINTTISFASAKSADSNIGSIIEKSDVVNEAELIKSMTDNLSIKNDNEDSNYVGTTRDSDLTRKTSVQVADTTADSISWFTQYNSHNVAKKLIELGSSKIAAQEAGNAVQNYSLIRTTRQRVRKFLSQRDSIWASSSSPLLKSGNINEDKMTIPTINDSTFITTRREQNYNIDSIIDVLIDAGLTGKDIAAVFTHTPSVSMMQAKNKSNNMSSISKGDSLEATLNRSYFGVLCSTIGLRKCDARKVCLFPLFA